MVVPGVKEFDQPAHRVPVPVIQVDFPLSGLEPTAGNSFSKWLRLGNKDVFVDVESLYSVLGGDLDNIGGDDSSWVSDIG